LTSLRLRRITSSSSQTLCRRLVRTTYDRRCGECSTLAAVRHGFVFHFATRTVDNTVDLYAAKPDIGPESRFVPTPPAFDAPVRGFRSEYCHPVWYGETRMVWLRDGEKISKICIRFDMITNMPDGQTDRQIPHDSIGRAYA